MSDIILKGRVVFRGFFRGEANVSRRGFGFFPAIDPVPGIVRDKRKNLKSKYKANLAFET